MKNLFFTLFFAFGLAQWGIAQNNSAYEVTPNPADTIMPTDAYDNPAKSHIYNTSSDTIKINWVRNEVFLSPGITTAVCDPIKCWFPGVSSKTFPLPADTSGELSVHFYNANYDPPPGQAGSGIVHLKLTNENDAADSLTVVFTYNTLTGTSELPEANVRLSPNPTTDFFTLENANEVGSMRLFTLDGLLVARFEASANNTYSIAGQPAGIYVLSFEDKNGQLFQAVELQKR